MPTVLTSHWGLGSVTVVDSDGGLPSSSPSESGCSSSNVSSNNNNHNRKTLTAPASATAVTAAAETAPAPAPATATATSTTTTATATSASRTMTPSPPPPPPPPALTPRSTASDGDRRDEEEDGDDDQEPTGKTLWDCAKVLYDLVANPDPSNIFSVRGKRVIELGAGTGALSVGLARAGAASVTCTDLPCHLAYMKSTVETNMNVRSNSKSSVKSCAAGKFCHDADDSATGISDTVVVANSNGSGGSGSGDGGRKTEVCRASFPAEKVRVVALRWGEEEDIARAREMSDSEAITATAAVAAAAAAAAVATAAAATGAAAGTPAARAPAPAARAGTLLEACQIGLPVGEKGHRSGHTVASAAAPTGTFGSSTSVVADVDKTAAQRNETNDPIASPPSSTMVLAAEGKRTKARGEVGVGGSRAGARVGLGVEEGVGEGEGVEMGEEVGAGVGVGGGRARGAAFDMIVLSEVLYWPALDLFQVDTRDPLRRTLVGLSRPGTIVVLIYKERWPEREKEFLASCEGSFEVGTIPAGLLTLPGASKEELGSGAIRAMVMVRLPTPSG